MPNTRHPRMGSLQFWPRRRAKKAYAKVRTFTKINKTIPVGFAGYKVGMTHVSYIDNKKSSPTKGEEVSVPVTIIECPPIKIYSVRFYKKTSYGLKVVNEFLAPNLDKELSRKVTLPKENKKEKIEDIKAEEYDEINVLLYTKPKTTNLGKKKPEIFEMGLGGSNQEKLDYIKENLEKEILVENIFEEGQLIDTHAITRGKGFQGTTKRFGTAIRGRKVEKHKRGAANLGAWTPSKVAYSINHAGKQGFNTRTQYNSRILKISNEPSEIQQAGGIVAFGEVKGPYILVKGSITGPKKRLIIFKHALRYNKAKLGEAPSIAHISTDSKQG
ncbi:50S ribosomal protein L3 [archaeon]|jgi:large subunit ribosomal protein L3|nr:50S ribosomal protein L3 [archaeon]MBT4646828.1 50S ribosomal protein L3 [archaeon]MBT6822073.1 50S ribosomal protein L3 [archaeon]MBT7392562.1 50S ribosomal protein L3 [archaeon]